MKELIAKNGRWVWIKVGDTSNAYVVTHDYRIRCSSCGIMPGSLYGIPHGTVEMMVYCPCCGAKMTDEVSK